MLGRHLGLELRESPLQRRLDDVVEGVAEVEDASQLRVDLLSLLDSLQAV